MPTMFLREFGEKGRLVKTLPMVTGGCEWVAAGEGVATEKVDGSCCAIINGKFRRGREGSRTGRSDASLNRTRSPGIGLTGCRSIFQARVISGWWLRGRTHLGRQRTGPTKRLVRTFKVIRMGWTRTFWSATGESESRIVRETTGRLRNISARMRLKGLSGTGETVRCARLRGATSGLSGL